MENPDHVPIESFGIDPVASRRIFLGMMALALGGIVAFYGLRQPVVPPSHEVAADPLLLEGRDVYLGRCVSCHGTLGKGDGPLAKSITGPSVGDLTIAKWKHGDSPDEVLTVISLGVAKSQMPGWKSAIGPLGVKAVAAYVYHLAGREVPQALRAQ